MANILDYVTWRGDLPLSFDGWNAVDAVILATACYSDFPAVTVPGARRTLKELAAQMPPETSNEPGNLDRAELIRRMAASKRFGGLMLHDFVNVVDTARNIQFAAVTVDDPLGGAFVAFRGTDKSLVGWKEDFMMAFETPVPAQTAAVRYLSQIAARTRGPLRVAGHSKGGNLAIYAAAFCGDAAFERVLRVYSNDGPGFNQAVTASAGYARVVGRSVKIIPEASLVGILLNDREERLVVKSSASGVMQHNPYSWEVLGTAFVPAERDNVSVLLDEALTRWLNGLSDAQRENLTDALFDALAASGADTFDEINANRLDSLGAIAKAIGAMDPALQKDVLATLHKLADAGWDVFWNDARRNLRQGIGELRRGRRPGPSGEQRGREC